MRFKFLHLHLHGLLRSQNLELGRDPDTGGQTKYVLELGGGFSTIAICYALQYNYEKHGIKGNLISYDQSKYYLNLTKKIIP